MSTSRSIKRKKLKAKKKAAKKAAKQKIKNVNDAVSQMPTVCTYCGEPFDKTVPENLDTWHISMFSGSKIILLTCPECLKSK